MYFSDVHTLMWIIKSSPHLYHYSPLPTRECERPGQLSVEQHDGFLECQQRCWSLFSFSNFPGWRIQWIVYQHKHIMFHRQRELWKYLQCSCRLEPRQLHQPAEPDPKYLVRYENIRHHWVKPSGLCLNTPVYRLGPCQPQGIKGNLDCVTNSVFVLWDATPGADSYTVTAVDGGDYLTNCTTSTNTTCEVKGLACGALYNFSVTAKNMQCESQPSATINLQTGNSSFI